VRDNKIEESKRSGPDDCGCDVYGVIVAVVADAGFTEVARQSYPKR
jgi:hypothetical protein